MLLFSWLIKRRGNLSVRKESGHTGPQQVVLLTIVTQCQQATQHAHVCMLNSLYGNPFNFQSILFVSQTSQRRSPKFGAVTWSAAPLSVLHANIPNPHIVQEFGRLQHSRVLGPQTRTPPARSSHLSAHFDAPRGAIRAIRQNHETDD
jgi:hypothetical protein